MVAPALLLPRRQSNAGRWHHTPALYLDVASTHHPPHPTTTATGQAVSHPPPHANSLPFLHLHVMDADSRHLPTPTFTRRGMAHARHTHPGGRTVWHELFKTSPFWVDSMASRVFNILALKARRALPPPRAYLPTAPRRALHPLPALCAGMDADIQQPSGRGMAFRVLLQRRSYGIHSAWRPALHRSFGSTPTRDDAARHLVAPFQQISTYYRRCNCVSRDGGRRAIL